MEKNSLGKLSTAEHHELTLLVERGDQLMLRKAEALRLLHERGDTGSTKDYVPSYAWTFLGSNNTFDNIKHQDFLDKLAG